MAKEEQAATIAPVQEQGTSPLRPVIRYLRGCIGYESFIVLLSIYVMYYSGSHTAVFPFLFAVGGVLCLWLMLYTMKAAASGDPYRYPYGTGRLENVSAIMLSLMVSLGTMLPLVQVLQTLWAGEIREVSMGWTFVLLFFSAAGNNAHAFKARQLRKTNDNPILTSLHHMYHAGGVRDGFSCAIIGLCWMLESGNHVFMSRVDLIATLIFSGYSFYHYVPQIWVNFRALADFPLTEDAQLKVMSLLAQHFDAYEMPGRIYTTNRGNTPVFEVELAFKPELSIADLLSLEEGMRADFQSVFPGCVFRIIPRALPEICG